MMNRKPDTNEFLARHFARPLLESIGKVPSGDPAADVKEALASNYPGAEDKQPGRLVFGWAIVSRDGLRLGVKNPITHPDISIEERTVHDAMQNYLLNPPDGETLFIQFQKSYNKVLNSVSLGHEGTIAICDEKAVGRRKTLLVSRRRIHQLLEAMGAIVPTMDGDYRLPEKGEAAGLDFGGSGKLVKYWNTRKLALSIAASWRDDIGAVGLTETGLLERPIHDLEEALQALPDKETTDKGAAGANESPEGNESDAEDDADARAAGKPDKKPGKKPGKKPRKKSAPKTPLGSAMMELIKSRTALEKAMPGLFLKDPTTFPLPDTDEWKICERTLKAMRDREAAGEAAIQATGQAAEQADKGLAAE